MASVKGTNFTNITADPIVKIDSGEWSGKMRVQYDTYEASSLASGSDISVARLPKGAKVYDIVVHFDALGDLQLYRLVIAELLQDTSQLLQHLQLVKCLCLKKVQSLALATRTLQRQMYY